jgi:hypothetical protein
LEEPVRKYWAHHSPSLTTLSAHLLGEPAASEPYTYSFDFFADGWQYIEDHCIYISDREDDIYVAAMYCNNRSARIFEPTTEALYYAVYDIMTMSFHEFWLGINDLANEGE